MNQWQQQMMRMMQPQQEGFSFAPSYGR
jgi:hypothetical protein